MVDLVELYEDNMGNVALVHGEKAYTTSRYDLGESFREDAQNILDGHFQNMFTESRHALNLTKELRVASYKGGTMAVFVDPPAALKDYLGIHVDE